MKKIFALVAIIATGFATSCAHTNDHRKPASVNSQVAFIGVGTTLSITQGTFDFANMTGTGGDITQSCNMNEDDGYTYHCRLTVAVPPHSVYQILPNQSLKMKTDMANNTMTFKSLNNRDVKLYCTRDSSTSGTVPIIPNAYQVNTCFDGSYLHFENPPLDVQPIRYEESAPQGDTPIDI